MLAATAGRRFLGRSAASGRTVVVLPASTRSWPLVVTTPCAEFGSLMSAPWVCPARHASGKAGASGSGKKKDEGEVLLASTLNGVRTLTMNRPDKLNAWTRPMFGAIQRELLAIAKDDSVKVAILTGTGSYYCAGVNLSDTLRPMHPKKLFNLIVEHNQGLFDAFILFPKVRVRGWRTHSCLPTLLLPHAPGLGGPRASGGFNFPLSPPLPLSPSPLSPSPPSPWCPCSCHVPLLQPIIIAANGPAIGACVTTATLCDAIVASDNATFHTPFAALGIPPEGCSSVHFERMMGKANAHKMLEEGWKPTAGKGSPCAGSPGAAVPCRASHFSCCLALFVGACAAEAAAAGFVSSVVPKEQLQATAQALGEQWAKEGKVRGLVAQGKVQEYLAVNARESIALAHAFLDVPFLEGQYKFLKSRGKTQMAAMFWLLKTTQPLWSKLL
jgi:enoyl-CoA hydratase/carnithine racemase